MKEFKGRVAVVTGAASGIGRGMAETFVAAGMKVVLSDIEAPALEKTTGALRADGADVHAVRTDVSKPDQVDDLAKQTLSKYGAVHVLCNNAGIMVGGTTGWKSSLDDWRWIVGVNLMGVVHGIRSFLPIMVEQDSEAHIINTASLAGLIASGGAPYVATKFAVVGLSENVYVQLQREGLKPRVSILCPGFVDTNIVYSDRNRPAEFADASAPQTDPATNAIRERAAAELKKVGLSPRVVGEQVLAAIRDERFYILTHPELNPVIEQRMQDILSGNNPAVVPSPELMQKLNALRPR
jgi:NAD(P)-dependent dehydrogenase (short-subunit alcohol dehydrogenase family)